MFGSGGEQELARVFAVGDGASKPGKLMEDDRWFFGVWKKQVAEGVGEDVGNAEGGKPGCEEE